MKNLTVKTQKIVDGTIEVPEYFRIYENQFYWIVSEKTYVKVYNYGNDLAEMENLDIYPYISADRVSHLYIFIQDKELIPITKEEFTKQFDACVKIVATL